MERRLGCLLLVLAVLATGCLAPATTGEQPVGVAADDEAVVQPGGLAAVETAETNSTTVAVESAGDAEPPVGAVVRAVDYWRGSETAQAPYAVDPDAPDPDVVVRIGRESVECESGTVPGRADGGEFYCLERANGDGDDPAVVVLTPGLTEEGYASATAAALGHLAGVQEPFSRAGIEEPSYADPWPTSDPVTVRIDDEVSTDRNLESLVRRSLAYWERNDERWGTYATDWEIVDEGDADVTVAFVEEVQSCGDYPDPGSLIGCAPVRSPDTLADGDERVRVVAGYDDETTLLILKHEFGHLYGVSHGEEPSDVMVDSISTTPLSAD